MVNPGSSPHRHQARSKTDPARPHHRMVTLAQSSPSHRAPCAPQSKTATVMLGRDASPFAGEWAFPGINASIGRIADVVRYLASVKSSRSRPLIPSFTGVDRMFSAQAAKRSIHGDRNAPWPRSHLAPIAAPPNSARRPSPRRSTMI
jgi:hypothetical protein